MSHHLKQTKAHHSKQHDLDDAELEAVIGGAGFLSGSLTTQEVSAPRIDTDAGAQGLIMRDSIIVRTSR